jgi:hypothetical protein
MGAINLKLEEQSVNAIENKALACNTFGPCVYVYENKRT